MSSYNPYQDRIDRGLTVVPRDDLPGHDAAQVHLGPDVTFDEVEDWIGGGR